LWQSITGAVEPSNAKSEEPPKKKRKKTQEKEEDPKKKTAKKAPAEKAIRIRLYPNEEQKQTLLKWIGCVRWTYNKVVDAIEKDKIPRTKKALRAKCVNTELFNTEDTKWILNTPYDMRDEGMNDVLKAYTSNFAKDTGKSFEIKYRSKKDKQQSVVIHSKYWKCKRGHYAFLHEVKSAEPLPTNLDYDSRLIRTRLGEYYLCIPKPLELVRENQSHQYNQEEEAEGSGVIALDPGIRTFQTGFCADGTVTEWGKGDMSRIYRLCYAYDDLQSRWSNSKSNGMCKKCRHKKEMNPKHTHCEKCIKHKDVNISHRKRYRMKKAGLRILQRIRNLVDELHKKMVRWLCLHYRVVLLPEFETSKMLRRGQRRIGSKTARAMATWSHYRFKQRLLHKSREYPDCRIYIVNEAFTSKTCGHCGYIHSALGGSKVFKCPSCKWEIDRDVNGARNILIRFLTENMSDSLFRESR
jgi:putative transposase